MAELKPGAAPVHVGVARLSTDTVVGEVRAAATGPGGGHPGPAGRTVDALAGLGLRTRLGLTLQATAPPPAGGGLRAALTPPAEVVVEVEAPDDGQGQVILVDGGGALSWVLPEPPAAGASGRSRSRPRPARFRLRVAHEGGPGTGPSGPPGAAAGLARREVRVLTFDLVDPQDGPVDDRLAARWEQERRPHRLRRFTAADHRDPHPPALDHADLRAMAAAGGPALLLVHGINSLTHNGFAALPGEAVAGLCDRYRDRVMAFDHPSLSVDPLANARALAAMLPEGIELEVDVLCHSRGGLVARVLAERAAEAGTGGRLRVRQVVFVATPNAGTPLARPEHLGALLDALTNLAGAAAGAALADWLGGIVAVARQLAVGATGGLDGLVAMSPGDNPFLADLNTPAPPGPAPAARYRALAADYEPRPASPRSRWVRDAALDRLFGFEANDLVVPTASAYAGNGAPGFPVAERVVVGPARGVDHASLWTAPEALDALSAWLRADGTALDSSRADGTALDSSRADGTALGAGPARGSALGSDAGPAPAGSPLATDPMAGVEEALATGDIDAARVAVADLPGPELDRLRAQVGGAALDSFLAGSTPSARGSGARAGVVHVLPGIMGTHLRVGHPGHAERVWLNPLRLVLGGFRRLRVGPDAPPVAPDGMYRRYLGLVVALDPGWHVVPGGYDWRLPLEEAADELADRLRADGRPGHLVCHSMGGLVARMLAARHPEVWAALDDPGDRSRGGRLVMLGTPTLGSFAAALALTGDDHLVRWLAAADVTSTTAEITAVLGTFPGLYQLLTAPEAPVGDSDHADLYQADSWDGAGIDPALLAAAGAAHQALARVGWHPERTFYVAGSGHLTPTAVRVDPARPGRFSYRMTSDGDGRVPHVLGVPGAGGGPALGPGHVRYSGASHGDLPADPGVIAAVVDLLAHGRTDRLAADPPLPPPRPRAVAVADGWVPAELVDAPDPGAGPAAGPPGRGGPATGDRSRLQAQVRAEATAAVGPWLGSEPATATRPVLGLRVLHASLEYGRHPVMVGHYSGDPIAGAEGYLDRLLGGALTARQVAGRYAEAAEQVVLVPTSGRPPGALVIGLGARGDLTSSTLAAAARAGALEHALAWLDDPDRTGEGRIGLTTCLIGSYGVAGLTLPASVAAIVEGVILANVALAQSTRGRVAIGELEFVERYAGAAEEAAHAIRDVEGQLPGAVRDAVELHPDQCLHPGEGRRPAVRTVNYGAGQWHRVLVRSGPVDADGRMKLSFTSFGARARADDLEKEVDTRLLGQMLREAVLEPAVDERINTALFEMLFPDAVKRDLAGGDNVHLTLDEHVADFPWEALSDRGGAGGGGPVALRGGLLRQLSVADQRSLEPLTGTPGALVVGDPPGGERFPRLDGARREAEEVATLLAGDGRMAVEAVIFPPGGADEAGSASRVTAALLGDDYRIVHIAGHGHFERRPDGPPWGGVVIGPGAYLTAASLRSMRRPPDVVFLNCCHLGSLGATNLDDPEAAGDRAFTARRLNQLAASLSRELTLMGVRAVVAAGWAVADEPAAEFARSFYASMLAGMPFGEAVHAARTAAYESDQGASNTWAAYQCYGDPAFRLRDERWVRPPLPHPVSADEMQRRLEELEVAAREAGDEARLEISAQVAAQYPVAEREWPRKSRMWTAFGWAHATLGETERSIAAYRRALDRQDALAPIKAVEELADQEHRLYAALVGQGRPRAEAIGRPNTPAALRREAWGRLATLDRLGRSPERHALRARWHEREVGVGADRAEALAAAAAQYADAWRLSHDTLDRRSLALAVRARQLVGLGAAAPEAMEELAAFLAAQRSAAAAGDFEARRALADLVLAEGLGSLAGSPGRLADVVAAYDQIFRSGSAPDQRAGAVARIRELAALADPPLGEALSRVATDLAAWSPR